MKSPVAIVLILCGAGCIFLPWIHDMWYLRQVAMLLAKESSTSATLHGSLDKSFQWFSAFVGAGMIIVAIAGSWCAKRSADQSTKS